MCGRGEGACVGGFSGRGGGRFDSSFFLFEGGVRYARVCVYMCVCMRVCTGEEVVLETRY